MKLSRLILITVLFLAPLIARAQSNPTPAPDSGEAAPVIAQSQSETAPPPPPGTAAGRTGGRIMGGPGPIMSGPPGEGEFGPGLGAWWKNSEIVSKLQLSEEQVRKIGKTYLDHKLTLIDLQADLEKQELRLQPLMDIDQPDQSKVGAQIDLITAARGRLEKENAMMMLDIRRWMSVEQWKKLRSLQAAEEGNRNGFSRGRPGNKMGPPPPPHPGDMPMQPPGRPQ